MSYSTMKVTLSMEESYQTTKDIENINLSW